MLGFAVYFLPSDRPAETQWLTLEECKAIADDLAKDNAGNSGNSHSHFGAALKDIRLYMLAFIYFAITTAIYLISFWLPTMIHALGKFPAWETNLITTILYMVAVVGMLAIAARSVPVSCYQ